MVMFRRMLCLCALPASCYNNLGMYIPSILPGPQYNVAVYHYCDEMDLY